MTLPTASHAYKRGFSLVELMVVLAIMGIVAAVTMGAFSTLQSSALSSSGDQLSDVFSMARQNSIANNDFTAVVIKVKDAGAYSAYCLLQLTRQNDDGSSTALPTWSALTPWHYLQQGIVFDSTPVADATDPNKVNFLANSVLSSSLQGPLPTSFAFQGQAIDLTSEEVIVQCYQPDGTLLGETNPLYLRLVEGTVNSSSGVVTYHGAQSAGKPVNYYDLVFVANTGAVKIERP